MGGDRTGVEDPFAWVGATIDAKYRVESVVGEGGYGVVYRATHLAWQEPVAIKCLKLGTTVKGPVRDRFLESFLAEGKLLHRLSRASNGIVQALDAGAAISPNGKWSPYLALEWLDGNTLAQDLSERLSRGMTGRPLDEALDLLDPAVRAIVEAHNQGIAHRDLKPENLFLAQVGGARTMKVLDFGVAKVMGDVAQLTIASATTGLAPRAFSTAYGAPEQFEPVLGATGPWTDVYALGLVLIEIVTARQAYSGQTSEQIREEAIDAEKRPSFASLGIQVDDGVEAVIRKALAVDPRNRFATADTFWRDLRSAAQREATIRKRHPSRTESAPPVAPPPTLRAAPTARKIAGTTTPVVLGPPHFGPPTHGLPVPSPAPSRSALPFVLAIGATLLLLGLGGVALGVVGVRKTPVPPEMVLVPEGRYTVGSPVGDPRRCEGPTRVIDGDPFLIDRNEVTLAEYRKCQRAGRCSSTKDHAVQQKRWKGLEWCNELRTERGENVESHPMNCVDRDQALAYCRFVGKRLPTDDEWERAARGRNHYEYPWGNTPPSCSNAVFGRAPAYGRDRCAGEGTSAIASTQSSPLGVFDLAGNVWEWTSSACPGATVATQAGASSDVALPPLPAPTSTPTDPQEEEIARLLRKNQELNEQNGDLPKGLGTLRGGGFEWAAENLRSWKHLPWPSEQGGVSTGFRCAMSR